MFSFLKFRRSPSPYDSRPFGPSLLITSLLCLLFGSAILVAPELLAYIVATFLILVGVVLFMFWWRVRA
ncbi:DUF3096 domain-containing protein [Candidatus Uhrbacteria bacterium]|nr:DUF3096 domain-containing protein [Candidatus Uhrbacteria bacterium]